MVKIIILTNNINLDGMKLNKSDNVIVIGKKDAPIPMEMAQQLFESAAKLEYVEHGTIAEFAFLLGKLSVQETITEVITDIDELKILVGMKKPVKRGRKAADKTKSDDFFPMNTPEEPSKKVVKEEKTAVTHEQKKKGAKLKGFPDVKKSDVEKLLSANSLDLGYTEPIMAALNKSTQVITLDVNIRTEVAKYCVRNNIEDKGICAKICQVFTKEFM